MRAGNVDTLPEAGRGEENRVRRGLESLEQDRARRRSLQQQRKIHFRAGALVNIAHLHVAGEQAKRSPLRNFEKLHDFVRCARGKARVAHVGQIARNVQKCLLAEIELLRQDALAHGFEAQPLFQIIEMPGDGERRGGENDGVKFVEKLFAQISR